MRFFLFLFGIFLFLNASELETLYKNGKYEKICKNRWKYINKYIKKNEKLVSLVGDACLKKRYIIPALDVSKSLTKTKYGRENATYIATLYLIEKILIQVLKRDISPYKLSLPIIKDNDLGIVFNELSKGNYKWQDKGVMFYKDGIKYEVYLNSLDNIVIIKNGKKEIYW